jgi:hypothetical protein
MARDSAGIEDCGASSDAQPTAASRIAIGTVRMMFLKVSMESLLENASMESCSRPCRFGFTKGAHQFK